MAEERSVVMEAWKVQVNAGAILVMDERAGVGVVALAARRAVEPMEEVYKVDQKVELEREAEVECRVAKEKSAVWEG